MEFQSEKERLAHPLASLFPAPIWDRYIGVISEFELSLMANDANELKAYFPENNPDLRNHLTEEKYKIRAFLAIVYGHPSCSDAELFQFAKSINLSRESLFRCIIIIGNIPMFDRMLERDGQDLQHQDFINNGKLFYTAAMENQLDIIDRILGQMAPNRIQEMIYSKHYKQVFLNNDYKNAVLNAARNGHTDTIRRLIELLPPALNNDIYCARAQI